MAGPTTKQELIAAMHDGYNKLQEQIAKMTADEKSTPFAVESDPKKCGVRWQNDRCLRDLLIHLYEWQVLMQTFVQNIREGHQRDYLPDEYRKNYHEMDKMLVEKHQQTPLEEATRLLAETHNEMLRLADGFTEEELFSKGFYKCTYTTTMAAYFVSVTTSPYSQAVKILKSHQKQLKKAK
ncbi:MAG: ClbS/DfsB family four-helix bundle protein [Muribaculaceae bacterium]|nr:ClbS/DfsB family four-helix bundle protein [Muribaculaceae bacterium]